MRKLLFLILLLFPLMAYAEDIQLASMNPYIAGSTAPAAAGGGSFTCAGDTGLLCDNFENTGGTCGDDANTNCYKTWAAIGTGVITNQATGLEGSYAKSVTESHLGASIVTYASFTAGTPRYAFVRFKITTLTYADDASAYIVFLSDVSDNSSSACALAVRKDVGGDNNLKFRVADDVGGAYIPYATIAPTQGTEYCAWIEFQRNTASGCNVYIVANSSPPCTKPGTAYTPGTTTRDVDAGYIYVKAYYSDAGNEANGIVVDRIRVNSSAYSDDVN